MINLDVETASQYLGNLNSAAIQVLWMGIIATLMTDLWQVVLRTIAGLPPANWALVGRWVAWMPRGVFVHRPITMTARIRGELAIGWAFHYAVGIAYAAIYLIIVGLGLGSEPTLLSAMTFAIVLLVVPWFVMQPALGFGIMARRAPNVTAVRAVSVSTHAAFGVGLYLGSVMWKLVLT